MAHFAELNDDNVVLRVIVVDNNRLIDSNGYEQEHLGIAYCKSLFGNDTKWRQTSYNANFRKNYAGIGYKYDVQRDAFIPPKPFNSWSLNESTCRWDPPVFPPDTEKAYKWDEDNRVWIEIV